MEDEIVHDHIILGVKSAKVREKLINEGSELTLQKSMDIARTHEISQKQLKSMFSQEDPKVHIVKQTTNKKSRNTQSTRQRHEKTEVKCNKCGYEHKFKGATCPAYGKKCNLCKKMNHFASQCRSEKPKYNKKNSKMLVQVVENYLTDDSTSDARETDLYVGMENDLPVNRLNDDWTVCCIVNNKTLRTQVDTGARCNVISQQTLKSLQVKTPLEKSEAMLRSYSGHAIKSIGTVKLQCNFKDNNNHVIQFQVIEKTAPTIIGAESAMSIGLVKRLFGLNRSSTNNDSQVRYEKLKEEYSELFSGKGPTDWVNSMVTVTKPNGKIRICLDPRDLNTAIKRQHYPMLTIEEIVAWIPEAKYFSKLDATSGFWQLQLDEPSSKLCTFNTPFGRYRFLRMPFGLNSAPEVFQSVMSNMVEDIDGAEAIVDDILVWGKSVEEHDRRLQEVLQSL
ncbi:uncharacterized protein LOC132562561 [Ylistrum balloti]|uniref:uncharacterized protein LOC132562561 n=1 Tax=Ylistrum balloti TaxID=509963 RepID=UPI002905D183|nr:uncharacterized protein LOC132562561 [Ylistrum balloti]